MNRVVASNVSQYFEQEHRAQGVKIIDLEGDDILTGIAPLPGVDEV